MLRRVLQPHFNFRPAIVPALSTRLFDWAEDSLTWGVLVDVFPQVLSEVLHGTGTTPDAPDGSTGNSTEAAATATATATSMQLMRRKSIDCAMVSDPLKNWIQLKSGAHHFWYDTQSTAVQMSTPKKPTIISHLAKAFKEADADGSGTLGVDEFKTMLMSQNAGLSHGQIEKLLAHAEADGDGVVSWREFIEAVPQILAV